ncbi:MAG: hypothetical protein JRJ21_09895, partial [Deltaproteobacteria bacterium]|nr:hypothetical protein [Deltaproteobacteria bacterium]
METISEKKKGGKSKIIVPVILLALVVFTVVVMFINSKKPDRIMLGKLDTQVRGAAFIKTNQALLEHMYGNWLPNDIFWPTALLDPLPHSQMGHLEVVRYNVRVP